MLAQEKGTRTMVVYSNVRSPSPSDFSSVFRRAPRPAALRRAKINYEVDKLELLASGGGIN